MLGKRVDMVMDGPRESLRPGRYRGARTAEGQRMTSPMRQRRLADFVRFSQGNGSKSFSSVPPEQGVAVATQCDSAVAEVIGLAKPGMFFTFCVRFWPKRRKVYDEAAATAAVWLSNSKRTPRARRGQRCLVAKWKDTHTHQ